MHLDQHVHAQIVGGGVERLGLGIGHGGHDDQHAVRAMGPGLEHLIGIVEEILTQRGQMRGLAGALQRLQAALKRRAVREHGETRRPGGLIGAGEHWRVEVGADHALGGARLFDLGDQRDAAFSKLLLDGVDEAARRIMIARLALQGGQRHSHFRLGDLGAFVGFDFVQNVDHFLSRYKAATRCARPPPLMLLMLA